MEPEVSVQQVIVCKKERRGDGNSKQNPIRILTEVFTLQGEKIAEHDPGPKIEEHNHRQCLFLLHEFMHKDLEAVAVMNKFFSDGAKNIFREAEYYNIQGYANMLNEERNKNKS